MNEKQVKAFRLADNKVSELAEWDISLLNEELSVLGDFDMGDYGFEVIEQEPEAYEDDFDFDENIEEEPKAKMGQIFRLGNHILMCGDSTTSDVDKLVKDEEIDLVVTDPPYNVNYGQKQRMLNKYIGCDGNDDDIENDYMDKTQFYEFLVKAFERLKSALKPGGSFYIWYATQSGSEFSRALEDVGLQSHQDLIWNKNQLVLGKSDYQWKHEPCKYGWKEGAAHYFISERDHTTVIEDEDFHNFDKKHLIKLLESIYSQESSIIDCERPTKAALHPTMKPIKLMGYLIKNSSKPGEKVLDLFGGSGSTLIACEQLGRKCYMMEYDPKYVDVIIERWETLTGQKAELIDG